MQNFLNFYTTFFCKQKWLKCLHLFAKNMKGWSHKKIIFYFFCKFDLPRKKLENSNFMGAALLCANISQIFFFFNWVIKNICCCLSKNLFNWSLHFFHILQQACWNANWFFWKSLLQLRWVSTRTQISVKSETDFKYFCLKCTYLKKWKPRCVFLNFQFP